MKSEVQKSPIAYNVPEGQSRMSSTAPTHGCRSNTTSYSSRLGLKIEEPMAVPVVNQSRWTPTFKGPALLYFFLFIYNLVQN